MAVVNGTSEMDFLYGAANDVVFGYGGNDILQGSGNNTGLNGGSGNDFLSGSGTDYIDYSNDASEGGSRGVNVNLNEVNFSTHDVTGTATDGFGNTDIIRHDREATTEIIHNVVGTNVSDSITGQAIQYTYAIQPGTYDFYYREDVVANNLYGLGGNDFLSGLAGNDQLYGGADNDLLDGGIGADYLDGGTGFDLATYADSQTGLFATLATPGSSTGDAAGDIYISIEGLVGSYGDDTLVTTRSGRNQLWGSSGNDSLYALGGHNYINGGNDNDSIYSNGGYNAIDGDAGIDIVRYDYATSGIVAALDPAASPYNSGEAAGDTYTSIEGLTGSNYADVLFGDAASNQLYGRGGNDFLIGNDGDDALYGGTGANELLGGNGNDYFNFYGSELEANVTNQIDDFTSLPGGNMDHLYLFGVSSGDVSFVPLMTGTNVNIAVSGGIATIFVANAGIANVQSHTSFF
jgi:Ca2+-binding RTX toxin-like protein